MKIIRHAPPVEFTFEANKLNMMGQFLPNAWLIKIYLPEFKTHPESLPWTIEHEAIHVGIDDMDFEESEEEAMIDAVLQARWEEKWC